MINFKEVGVSVRRKVPTYDAWLLSLRRLGLSIL